MGDLARSGVSLAALRALAAKAGPSSSTQDVVHTVIRPATASKKCSYVETLKDEERGQPSVVCIHAWTAPFAELVEALSHARLGEDEHRLFFWLDVLALNLHDGVPPTDTPIAGPPASALDPYRKALLSVAHAPVVGEGATAKPSAILALVLSGDAAVLTSPWCLYGVWLYERHRRLSSKPPALTTLCATGLDALLIQLVWEELSLLQENPHTAEALQTSILEEIATEEPIPLPQPITPSPRSKSGALGSSSGAMGGADATAELMPDIEGRVSSADTAIRLAILTSAESRVKDLTAATAAAEAAAAKPAAATAEAPSATATLEPATPEPTAAAAAAAPADGSGDAKPSPAPPPASPADAAAAAAAAAAESECLVRALAAASDAYGCLAWAAGRPADGEPLLRRARDLRQPGLSGAQPVLSAHATLHLGALLHILYFRSDEPELLLRSAMELLDALDGGGGGGSGVGGGGGGGGGALAAPLLVAQARHFLAQLITLRVASHREGAALRNAAGAHHLKASGAANGGPAPAAGGGGSNVGGSSGTGNGSPANNLTGSVHSLHGGASMQLPQGSAPGEVLPLLREALPAFERHYGAQHPLTATLLSNLALALKDHGQIVEAEALLRRALGVRRACHGPTHTDTLRCMNNLAGMVEALGRLEEAEGLLRSAAELAAASLGPMHAYTAASLSNLGVVLRKSGKLEEAEELFKTALEIREKVLGPIHLDTAASVSDMTAILLDQGRLAEAEPLFRRILDIRELVLGPGHKDTAASLCDLAALLAQLNRTVDAEPLLRRAVSVHVRALGPSHEDTASSTRELAKVLAAQGNTAEAEKHFRRALGVLETVLGPSHPETAMTLNQLAVLLRDTGSTEEAEGLFRRVLALQEVIEKQGTPSDPAALAAQDRLRAAVMIAMRGIADVALEADRLEEAEELSCRALVASEQALGALHPVTLDCAEALASVLVYMECFEDAADLYARLIETLAEEQGDECEGVIKYLALYEEACANSAAREAERKRFAEQGEGEGGNGAGGDDQSSIVTATTATTAHSNRSKPRTGATLVHRSGASTTAVALAALMGQYAPRPGAGPAPKPGAAAKRVSVAAPADLVDADGAPVGRPSMPGKGGSGGDGDRTFTALVNRISFAGNVGGSGGGAAAAGGADASERLRKRALEVERAHSVVERVHSTLVAAGRISSITGMPGPDHPVHRLARASQGQVRPYAGGPGGAQGGPGGTSGVSPGLPDMGPEGEAAGAANVSLDTPPVSGPLGNGAGHNALSPTPKGGVGSKGNTASGAAHAGGRSPFAGGPPPPDQHEGPAPADKGNRTISGKSVGRKSSVDGGGRAKSARGHGSALLAMRGSLSKKALLAQAEIDLDSDEDEGSMGAAHPLAVAASYKQSGAGGDAKAPSGSGGAGGAGSGDEEDTVVGCCGFGKRKAKITPAGGH